MAKSREGVQFQRSTKIDKYSKFLQRLNLLPYLFHISATHPRHQTDRACRQAPTYSTMDDSSTFSSLSSFSQQFNSFAPPADTMPEPEPAQTTPSSQQRLAPSRMTMPAMTGVMVEDSQYSYDHGRCPPRQSYIQQQQETTALSPYQGAAQQASLQSAYAAANSSSRLSQSHLRSYPDDLPADHFAAQMAMMGMAGDEAIAAGGGYHDNIDAPSHQGLAGRSSAHSLAAGRSSVGPSHHDDLRLRYGAGATTGRAADGRTSSLRGASSVITNNHLLDPLDAFPSARPMSIGAPLNNHNSDHSMGLIHPDSIFSNHANDINDSNQSAMGNLVLDLRGEKIEDAITEVRLFLEHIRHTHKAQQAAKYPQALSTNNNNHLRGGHANTDGNASIYATIKTGPVRCF